jgi:hypothetical protein
MLWTSDETCFAHTLGAALIYPAQLAYSISEDRLFGVYHGRYFCLLSAQWPEPAQAREHMACPCHFCRSLLVNIIIMPDHETLLCHFFLFLRTGCRQHRD